MPRTPPIPDGLWAAVPLAAQAAVPTGLAAVCDLQRKTAAVLEPVVREACR